MKFYCVSHKPPAFEIEIDYTHFCSKDLGLNNQVIIPDDFYGESFHGDILSEYTQLFGLADFLSRNENPQEKIYIFQYRKFITTKPANQVSTNMPYAHAYLPLEAKKYFPTTSDLNELSEHLVGPIVKYKSVANQYAAVHLIQDYCKFICSLSLSGDFSIVRCANFADSELLIPSPSLGLTQVGIFISHMNILKSIWSHFYKYFYIQRNGYQRRVGGFLLERLHSFLILEEIKKENIKFSKGQQIVISNSLVITRSE